MRPVEKYQEIFEQTGFENITVQEPLLKNKEVLEKYPKLKKYSFYPLYLFLTGFKSSR